MPTSPNGSRRAYGPGCSATFTRSWSRARIVSCWSAITRARTRLGPADRQGRVRAGHAARSAVRHQECRLHPVRHRARSRPRPAAGSAILADFPNMPDLAADPQRAGLTVEHALTMTLGIEWNERFRTPSPANSEIAMEYAPDRLRFVLERPAVEAPGHGMVLLRRRERAPRRPRRQGSGKALPDSPGGAVRAARHCVFRMGGRTGRRAFRRFRPAPDGARPRADRRPRCWGGRWAGRTIVSREWLTPRSARRSRRGTGWNTAANGSSERRLCPPFRAGRNAGSAVRQWRPEAVDHAGRRNRRRDLLGPLQHAGQLGVSDRSGAKSSSPTWKAPDRKCTLPDKEVRLLRTPRPEKGKVPQVFVT